MAVEQKTRTALKIAEISGVDMPAQEGAKAVIMKRKPDADTPKTALTKVAEVEHEGALAKSAALTTVVDFHTHLLYTSGTDGQWDVGTTSWHRDGNEDYSHSHPWVRGTDGQIVLGEVHNHTHEIAVVTKMAFKPDETPVAGSAGSVVAKEANIMPNDKTPAAPTVETLQKQLARATTIGELNDVQKAHFTGLKGEAQDAFLAKSADERQAEVDAIAKNADAADPVEYTTSAGIEIRKSAGVAMIAMAKSVDATAAENAALRKNAEDTELRKRATDDFKHLPGDVDTRMALLKSVDGIEDKTRRDLALTALKAQDAALGKAFETNGHGGAAPAENSADAQLEELAKAYQKDNAGTSFAKSYDAVLNTEAGQALYAASLN